MKSPGEIIDGTASEVIRKLADVPPDQRVRAIVGRPSLTVIARRSQATAALNGMTDEIHDELIGSLTDDR